jgi:hypothetical protein
MDIISHGLWGGVGFGRKNKRLFFLAVLFGMLPDLLSFGVFTVATWFGINPRPDWSAGTPPMELIPEYVHVLYNITHSLVVFTLVCGLLWWLARSYLLPFLAYGFAVLIDIPTHSTDFFATPFLWPLSSYTFNGVSWGEPFIFFPNVVLLVVAYSAWFGWYWYRRSRNT